MTTKALEMFKALVPMFFGVSLDHMIRSYSEVIITEDKYKKRKRNQIRRYNKRKKQKRAYCK